MKWLYNDGTHCGDSYIDPQKTCRVGGFEPLDRLLVSGENVGTKEDKDWIASHGLEDVWIQSGHYGSVILGKIVAKEKNAGAGTRFMDGLVNWADKNGKTVLLTPDDSFGASSVNRLKGFYRRFGFKPNKGRSADYRFSETMIRRPQQDTANSDNCGTGAGGFKEGNTCAKGSGLSSKVFVHETDVTHFNKFDMSKIGSEHESWLGRGIYLQEQGTFKIENYGANKVEAKLTPEAKIFEVEETPDGEYRDSFVEYAVQNNIGLAKELAEIRVKEGLSLKNLLPRDILRNNPEATIQLQKSGYDGLLQDGELVVYNDKVLKIVKWADRHAGNSDGIPCGDSFISSDKTCRVGTGTDTAEFKAWFGKSKVVDSDGKPLRVYHGGSKGIGDEGFSAGSGRGVGLAYFTDSPEVASKYAFGGGIIEGTTSEEYADKLKASWNAGKLTKRSPTIAPVYLSIQNPITEDSTLEDLFQGNRDKAEKVIYEWSPVFREKIENREFYDGPIGDNEWWETATTEVQSPESWAAEDTDALPKQMRGLVSIVGNYRQHFPHIDGMIYNDQEAGSTTYVVFEPTQIKSVFNRGTWSRTDPHISNIGLLTGGRWVSDGAEFANIDFDKPTPFKEAVKYVDDKKLLPTTLSSEQLMQLSPALREKAMFSAKTNNAWYLQQIKNKIDLIVGPEDAGGKPWRGLDAGSARAQLKSALKKIGYQPDPKTKGTIQDLSSDARLNLIVSTQTDMAHGFGQRMKALRPAVLELWPAWEFYREESRMEPRDWESRWEEAGGEFYEGESDYPAGRMVALKTSEIWSEISAFGLPQVPFDYNSGMGLREVSREECVELGLITEDEDVTPEETEGLSESDYLDTIKSTTSEFDPEILDDLLEDLGEGYAVVKGILQMIANSQECGASWISDDKTCRVGIPTVTEAEKQLEDAKNNFRRIAKEEGDTSGPKADAAYEKVIEGRQTVKLAKLNQDRPGAVPLTRETQDAMLKDLQDMNGGVDKYGFANFKWKRGEFIKELDSIGKMYKAVPTGPAIVYRGVTSQDWERMQKQGFMDSDRRGAISSDEGMNLTPTTSTAAYYIPEGEEGVVLAIDASKSNLFKIEADEYLRTHDKIPLDRVLKHSGIIGKHADAGGYYYPSKMAANDGQPCGDSFIAPEKQCRIGSGNSRTDTPEFKAWFGSSKVVDKDGKPLRVYHTSKSQFDKFQESEDGELGRGNYFTGSSDYRGMMEEIRSQKGEVAVTYPIYVSLKNPLILKDRESARRFLNVSDSSKIKGEVLRRGHDGIMQLDFNGDIRQAVVYKPSQIKSVFNRGTWSKVDADIGNEQNAGLSTTH